MPRNHHAVVAYLAARSRTPFAWGHDANDCISHAAGAVEAQTGKNPLEGKGTWSSARGAARLLGRFGGIVHAIGSVLEEIEPAMAQRGDIALVKDPEGQLATMVVEGATLVGPGPNGHVRLPRSAMLMAWSAG